jgi:hypothetical protein
MFEDLFGEHFANIPEWMKDMHSGESIKHKINDDGSFHIPSANMGEEANFEFKWTDPTAGWSATTAAAGTYHEETSYIDGDAIKGFWENGKWNDEWFPLKNCVKNVDQKQPIFTVTTNGIVRIIR